MWQPKIKRIVEGVSKKSGQIFWSLQQKQLFLEQKYTLDGQNYASKRLIRDIAHVCVSKTFGDVMINVRKLYFKKLPFCNFFFKKSGYAFWPLLQKPWLLEQKCSLDGPNNGS